MAEKWTWDEMLAEFRALGGVADNVCSKTGPHGRGIFPLDPSQPILMHNPENLLFGVGDVAFDNGALRIKNGAKVGAPEKAFFETYESEFSWGAGGRDDAAGFVGLMDQLPGNVRDLLAREFGFQAFYRGSEAERIEARYLKSRMLRSKGRPVLMPVIELVNHGTKGAPFEYKDGIQVKGTFSEEVLAQYSIADPLGVLAVWGFASQEPVGFSQSMKIPLGSRHLIVRRNFHDKAKLGQIRAPSMKIEEKAVTLSSLMLGNSRYPRLPKGVFFRLMKDLGQENADELFDRIQHFNRIKLLKLMAALEGDSPGLPLLRQVCRYQMEAISNYIGTREI